MSDLEDVSSNDLIVIARAVRTRGLKGEVVAELLTDFPDRFAVVDQLVAIATADQRKVVELEDYWFQKDRVILKFTGYDDIDKAGELVGCEFAIPDADRVPLEDGEYYDFELEGCTVRLQDGFIVGSVQEVLKTGGTEILLIVGDDGREHLVPLAAEMILEIDTSAKHIVVDPPEGLLDL
jgi:16S rRNA processing protein RimM